MDRSTRLRAIVATVTVALLALATSSLAQTWRQDAGVHFPGQAVANPRGALALSTNPAGLTGLRGFEGRLQLSGGGNWVAGSRGAGWGTFAGLPLGSLILGTSLENVRDTPPNGTEIGNYDINRISFGGGLRLGDRLSLGAATRMHGISGPAAGWAQSWDLGLLVRPWSWASFGGRVTGMAGDADDAASRILRTRYAWGVALRPLAGSDRITVALDLEWPEGDSLGAITGSLRSRIMDGVSVMLE